MSLLHHRLAALMLIVSSLGWAAEPLSFQQLTELPQPPAVEPIAYGSAPLQFGELRLPAGEGPFPVVLILHGGCWFAEYDMTHIRPLAQAITDLGFATWTLEYRRIGDEGGAWPGTFADVADGSDYLQTLADGYPLNLNQVIAVGHSAGGQLALWLPTRDRLADDHVLYRRNPLPVHAVIGLAAAAQMSALAEDGTCGEAARKVMAGMPDDVPQRYQAVSPHLRLPIDVPQVLINGVADKTWSPYANHYYQLARKAGDDVERIVVDGAGHFDLVAPQAPVWPQLQRVLVQLRGMTSETQ